MIRGAMVLQGATGPTRFGGVLTTIGGARYFRCYCTAAGSVAEGRSGEIASGCASLVFIGAVRVGALHVVGLG